MRGRLPTDGGGARQPDTQLLRRQSELRMPPIGVNVAKWIEHKAAPVHLGMRKHQPRAACHQTSIGDQVEVKHARPPFATTPTAERRLNSVKRCEKIGGRQGGCAAQRCIDIAPLFGADGCSGAEPGNLPDLHPSPPHRDNRRPQDLGRRTMATVTPVRTEGDDDGGLHVRGQALDGATMQVNPDRDCPLCPRLVEYRERLRVEKPDWYNAPVNGWGDPGAWLLVVGLAPGVTGANRTGRPFTGDYAGALLYGTLAKFGFTDGQFGGAADDGLTLDGVFIANAAACVPPQNKPLPVEVANCRPFLQARIASLPNLKVVVALGSIAHQSTVKALGGKLPKHPFGHGNQHAMKAGVTLVDSYHCSRLNTNTGRLTSEMFEDIFRAAVARRT